MAEEKKETPMLDPIAYRSDYKPEDISPEFRNDPNIPWVWPMNANENYQEYGDDSNPAWQGQKWWLNPKYEWEGVMNTYIDYDPNITTGGLDPNYLYWEAAKNRNSKEAGYIAKRNDMIASALYNEWKITRENVAEFLASQNEWMNSTEADRENTIESIYKRLWQIKPKEEQKTDTSEMEKDLQQEGWKLYWKDTPDTGDATKGIDTLVDDNSVYQLMNETRVSNLQNLLSNSDALIASVIISWVSPYSEQTMRDLQQYYPERYNSIMAEVKVQRTQNNVNIISSWEWDIDTWWWGVATSNWEIANFANDNATPTTSSADISNNINKALSNSTSANEASETMSSLEAEMATLKNRLKNLRTEANKAFKWDVPDYLVNAYINNKTQEIQNQLSILEDRYNAAYNRYKTDIANAQWQQEFNLKKEQLQLQKETAATNKWATEQWIAIDWYKATNWKKTSSSSSDWYAVANMSDEEIAAAFDKVMELYENWGLGNAQCAAGIQKYYLPLLGIELPNLSSYENKKKLINEGKDYVPKKWDLIIFSSSSSPNNWHIGIVIWDEFWDGTISYLDWNGSLDANWNWTEKPQTRTISLNDSRIQWYRNINKGYWWGEEDDYVSYNEDYATYYQKLIDSDYTAASRPEKMSELLWYESTEDFKNAAFAWKKDQDIKIAEEAKNKPSTWERKDGESFSMADTPTYDTLTYDQKNIVKQLLNLNKNPATVTKRQYWDDFERILSAVKEINPNWSDSDYWQMDKVKKEWNTSSKNGSNSRNGTAIATAKDIYDIADDFGNLKWKDWNGMLNKLKDKLSDEKYTELLINLEVLASEYAWALKGNNAAPTEQEIADKKEILAANLWAWAMKEAAITIAKTLYNKNANEAENYKNATLVKPPLVVTQDVADWMYNVAWIKELPNKYQYTPSISTWDTSWNWPKAPKFEEGVYEKDSIWDL